MPLFSRRSGSTDLELAQRVTASVDLELFRAGADTFVRSESAKLEMAAITDVADYANEREQVVLDKMLDDAGSNGIAGQRLAGSWMARAHNSNLRAFDRHFG